MIRSIRFDEKELQELGLKTHELTDLGSVVVLAGPNGGGKSRYLRLIAQKSPGALLVGSTHVTVDDVDPPLTSLPPFPPIVDNVAWTQAASQTGKLIQHAANHQDVVTVFAGRIARILDARITPLDPERETSSPLLDGRPYYPPHLSPGQRTLLTWCVFLGHFPGSGGVVALIDEPEIHLHPDACWRAIQLVRDAMGPDGQLWIGTHSLPLIAQLGVEGLHFVENGTITRATRTPSKVWKSLLGGEEARDKLLELLDGDAELAMIRFARECLLPPDVIGEQPAGDPQAAQLTALLEKRLATGETVRVLEIGAGKGRLVAAVAEQLRGQPEMSAPSLAYWAYNKRGLASEGERTACREAIDALAATGARARYTETLADVQARSADHVDVIVLANVLHEVPVEDWLQLFTDLRRCARPTAIVLVIEDQEPRVGEQPHPRGFLILERNEWRALCEDEIVERREGRGGRDLTAFEIPISALARANASQLALALEMVIDRCAEQVLALRAQPRDDHRAGRKHAFYAMMHLNATLAQERYPPHRTD